MVGIRGYGSYIPLYRIERSTIAEQHDARAKRGEIAVPAHDETVLSLAVSAAKMAREHADISALDGIYAATTSDPFDERGLASHVGAALGALGDVRVGDFQGSARAATNAILAARDAVEAGRGPVLVVATDIMTGPPGSDAEQSAGAAAGALVLGEAGDVASFEREVTSTTGFLGRFKRSDEPPRGGHGRFNRVGYIEAVGDVLDRLDGTPDSVVLPAPDDAWGDSALDYVSFETTRHSTFDSIGYVGAASNLVDLALALEEAEPDDRITLAGFGPGGADAVTFVTESGVTSAPETTTTEFLESKRYLTYAKHREYRRRARGET